MAQRHNSVRSYTLCEFAQEQEVNHREILREHLKEEKLHAKKMKVPMGPGAWCFLHAETKREAHCAQ